MKETSNQHEKENKTNHESKCKNVNKLRKITGQDEGKRKRSKQNGRT